MKDRSNSLVFMVALLAAFEQFAVGQGKFATVKNLQIQYKISQRIAACRSNNTRSQATFVLA